MSTTAHINRTNNRIALWLLLAVLILLCAVEYNVLRPGVWHYTCDSFGSYKDMITAFADGAYTLDGDQDGRPCEGHNYDHG